MESKSWYQSKTLWLNLIAAAAGTVQAFTGFVIDIEAQGAILIVLNIILRLVTKSAVTW